jgi:glyoxylase-like metal-dependent hydrolase (beta-lactamase superfamily II)
MLQRDVAPGIHRIEDAYTNWYIIEDEGKLTIVDAGLPRSWGSLQSALRELGRKSTDVEALVLTHAHFDHVGFAERARKEWGIPIWVHERDEPLSRHPLHYEKEHSIVRHALNPRGVGILATMILNGMPITKGVKEARGFSNDDQLDVPGAPKSVVSPGHTWGHVALHLPDRGVLISGDALVTHDPYTGRKGPRVVSGAATADSREALSSLQALADTKAQTVLPGHGEPWNDGIEAAVDRARENGAG